jgi:hypothetical protein
MDARNYACGSGLLYEELLREPLRLAAETDIQMPSHKFNALAVREMDVTRLMPRRRKV